VTDVPTAPDVPGAPDVPAGVTIRRPVEADHRRVVVLVDDWWGDRRLQHLLPRLWFQHFGGTSWIAESDDGRVAGFLVGFVSPDHPERAYVHVIGTRPNLRRQGLGRELYRRFLEDVAGRGVRQVRAITWAANRGSIAFHRRLGFRLHDGPGTSPIYGVPAFADYDSEADDKVLFILDL